MKSIFFLISVLGVTAFIPSAHAATTTPTTVLTQAQTQAKVREYFKDTPVMIEIARCESNFRQFTDAGNVLKGGSAGGMIGIFQFFESIHAPAAKNLGFNLETVDGNLAYAKHLYKTEGTNPWASAKNCWDVKTSTTTVASEVKRAQLLKQIEALKKIITLLQGQRAARK